MLCKFYVLLLLLLLFCFVFVFLKKTILCSESYKLLLAPVSLSKSENPKDHDSVNSIPSLWAHRKIGIMIENGIWAGSVETYR